MHAYAEGSQFLQRALALHGASASFLPFRGHDNNIMPQKGNTATRSPTKLAVLWLPIATVFYKRLQASAVATGSTRTCVFNCGHTSCLAEFQKLLPTPLMHQYDSASPFVRPSPQAWVMWCAARLGLVRMLEEPSRQHQMHQCIARHQAGTC